MRTLPAGPAYIELCIRISTSELGTPFYTEQPAGSQWCLLQRGSTVFNYLSFPGNLRFASSKLSLYHSLPRPQHGQVLHGAQWVGGQSPRSALRQQTTPLQLVSITALDAQLLLTHQLAILCIESLSVSCSVGSVGASITCVCELCHGSYILLITHSTLQSILQYFL